MNRQANLRRIGLLILLGSAWGLSEALLGLALRSCASTMTGSVMTSVALFFLAAGASLGRPAGSAGVLVLLAMLFKMFDSLLLSQPLGSGAVVNPIFAFALEGGAFIALASMASRLTRTTAGRSGLGALAGFGSAALFPLAGLVTGTPACLIPGTWLPLSWAYAPLAALFSALTVPLGYALVGGLERGRPPLRVFVPASVLVALAAMTLVRLARI